MTQASISIDDKCDFCDKRGLPLLLVRDGVAPSGGAPVSKNSALPQPGGGVHYTKRLLRSGYLNVFDEARSRWEAYFITSQGYYSEMREKSVKSLLQPIKPFNCPDEGHRALASCITIQDPKKAKVVWIGFSDVEWTDKVREQHNSAAQRQRHMTKVDVSAIMAGAFSTANWTPIPRQTGHLFHGKLDTQSSANWTPVPRQTGHAFHAKLDTQSSASWTVIPLQT